MSVARLFRRRRVAAGGLTGRALMLGLVVLFAVVVLASPLHRYLVARGELSQAKADRAASQAQLAQLQDERARWNDPAYVEQQARERLQYAKPGETVYVVVRPGDEDDETRSTAPSTSTVVGDSWSARMWNSVQAADDSR
ncbi:FtsB family cell division protein [Jatrophihabitans sp. YIM 134969]